MHMNNPDELRPWAIVDRDGSESKLAVWRIKLPQKEGEASAADDGALAVAIFSQSHLAEAYRDAHGPHSGQVIQLDQRQTLSVMLSAFQQGMHYAALDPSAAAARQIFVLREVLSAARQHMTRPASRGTTS